MGKLKVLVVDDNEDVRILVSTWLKTDYIIDTAVDGNDCLRKVKTKKYDVIFLDVMMPGPSSKDLVTAVVKALPKVKIIYLTAVEMFSPTQEQERKGYLPTLSEAIKGYLVKPVTKEQLIAKINEVFETEKLLK